MSKGKGREGSPFRKISAGTLLLCLLVLAIALYLALGRAAAANAQEASRAPAPPAAAIVPEGAGTLSAAVTVYGSRIDGLNAISDNRERWQTCHVIAENLRSLTQHWARVLRGTGDSFCAAAGRRIRTATETYLAPVLAKTIHQSGNTLYTLDPLGAIRRAGRTVAAEIAVESGSWATECRNAIASTRESLATLSPPADQCAQTQPAFQGNCSCTFRCEPRASVAEKLGKSVPAFATISAADHLGIDAFGKECTPSVVQQLLRPARSGPICDWSGIPASLISRR
jgi:hypothetical protein